VSGYRKEELSQRTSLNLVQSFFVKSLFRLNKFTSPAYVMSFVCLSALFCLAVYFADRYCIEVDEVKKKKSTKRAAIDDMADSRTCFGRISVFDACVLGCMLLNVSTKGSIACFETLGVAYAETHFNMEAQFAGMLVATCGTFGVLALLSMGSLEARFSDVQIISGGILVMTFGIVSLMGFEAGIENPHWRYLLAMFLIYAVGYPIGHTAVIGLFSKSK
jgi:MFS transporter, ceroid-lipofuscinosis neuronal protein 7